MRKSVRKLLVLLSLLGFSAIAASAQSNVAIDLGATYAAGAVTFTNLVPQGYNGNLQPPVGGASILLSATGTVTVTGLQSGRLYRVIACKSNGSACLLATVNVTGAAQDISATLSAYPIGTGAGSGNLSGTLTATRVPFASGATTLVDDGDMTFSTDTLTITKLIGSTSITDSGLTATQVTYAGTAGLLSGDADLIFTAAANGLHAGPLVGFASDAQYYLDISTSSVSNLNTSTAAMTSNSEGTGFSASFESNDNNVQVDGIVGVAKANAAGNAAVGVQGYGYLSTATMTGDAIGGILEARNLGGTASRLRASQSVIVASGGTTTNAYGTYASAALTGGATITNLYGNYILAPTLAMGTTVTNMYGLYIENQAGGGTLNYAIKTGTGLVSLGGNVDAPQLLASGIVDGKAPVTVTATTPVSVGGTYNSGYLFNEHATEATAITYNLPTAAAGKQYCIYNAYETAAETGVLTVATSASGQFIIFTDGTLSASGGNVASGGAARDAACFVGVDATHWMLVVGSGTWSKN